MKKKRILDLCKAIESDPTQGSDVRELVQLVREYVSAPIQRTADAITRGKRDMLRIPKHILARGPKWQYICYSRGSGQYPGGHPNFTGNQPPSLNIPCEDGTCQMIFVPIPDELIKHDGYTRGEE